MDTNPGAVTFDRFFLALDEWLPSFFSDESADLSLKEGLLLEVVGARKFIKMSDLAGLLRLPATTATSMVDRLVWKKLVKRTRFEDERRIVAVSLTEEGKAVWERRRRQQTEWLQGLLARLSSQERAQLIRIIDKISLG